MLLSDADRRRGVFVDTSALYAQVDSRDQWHRRAVNGFTQLLNGRRLLFATELVFAEMHKLCQQRLGAAAADGWLSVAHRFNLLFLDAQSHDQTVAVLETASIRRLSYTDAASFVLMKQAGIAVAFSFDHHFMEYGFAPFDA